MIINSRAKNHFISCKDIKNIKKQTFCSHNILTWRFFYLKKVNHCSPVQNIQKYCRVITYDTVYSSLIHSSYSLIHTFWSFEYISLPVLRSRKCIVVLVLLLHWFCSKLVTMLQKKNPKTELRYKVIHSSYTEDT